MAGGYCLSKSQRHKCPGIQMSDGCLGTDCFCCVPDTNLCINKPACTNTNGTCLEKAYWTDCNYEVDSSLCVGNACACCREKKCARSAECEDQGGYCFRRRKNPSRQHVCHGSEIPSGCGGPECFCCIPDPGRSR
ncbi:uncharacterized protein [Palaemon carinicauda]|uniref:uncharacterized protein n=1 Tax=Palaemon carinicauda TaxID=392227 RepID=UPI0035B59A4C